VINELEIREGETPLEHHKRLVFGKLLDKSLSDQDYTELSKYVYNQELSSDVCRREMYGSKYTLKLMEQNTLKAEPKSHLSEIREKVGELDIIKRQIQLEKSELKKMKNEIVKSISVSDDLKQYMDDINFQVSIPEYCSIPIDEISQYEMILHITDFHIGYVINDCKGNYYSFEIANQRIDKLISECYKYIEMYNIKKIYLVNTGDVIEHISMRANQSQFCEFNQSKQINKAIEIIYRLMVALCKFCDVEYDSIYGNHDRMNGDKKANLDGDNAEVIIREQLGKYVEISKNARAKVIDRKSTDKEIIKVINGVNCKFVHGEDKSNDGRQFIKSEISMDNQFYTLLFKGHLHNFKLESENNGRYIISTGCLSGYNDYSVNFGCTSLPSQTIVIVAEGKVELIKDVQLN